MCHGGGSRAGVGGTHLGEIRSIHGRPSVETVGMRPRCRRNSNCFAFFISRAFGPLEPPRGFEGGRKKAEAAQAKKNKKKYAIRDSNPENLLGRQKCYPYTNGVRAAPMGAQRRELTTSENVVLLGTREKTRNVMVTIARPRSRETKHFHCALP